MLTKLKWDVSSPTPLDFLDIIISKAIPSFSKSELSCLKQKVISSLKLCFKNGLFNFSPADLLLLSTSTFKQQHLVFVKLDLKYEFSHHPPSMIAAAGVVFAVRQEISFGDSDILRLLKHLQDVTSIEYVSQLRERLEDRWNILEYFAGLSGVVSRPDCDSDV